MRKYLSLALVAASVLFGPSVARADIIIDNFDDAKSQVFQRFGNGSTSGNQTATPGLPAVVLGKVRELDITIIAGGSSAVNGGKTTVDSGLATTSTDGGFTAQYDFIYDGGGTLLADLSSGDAFLFEARTDANAPLAGQLKVFDDTTSKVGFFSVDNLAPGKFNTVVIPFSNFPGINFSKITALVFTFNTDNVAEADTQIDNIRVRVPEIPEPASLAILAGCLAGAGGLRLLRRRKAGK